MMEKSGNENCAIVSEVPSSEIDAMIQDCENSANKQLVSLSLQDFVSKMRLLLVSSRQICKHVLTSSSRVSIERNKPGGS